MRARVWVAALLAVVALAGCDPDGATGGAASPTVSVNDSPVAEASPTTPTASPTVPTPSPTHKVHRSSPKVPKVPHRTTKPPKKAAPAKPTYPAGASAVCRDGTLSYSAHRRGTCSHHGGVARWL
ncbi:DUF3761 domain-containing protein [Actinomadura verrucosospora]|uniref:DUF3761 domain-containing protein n=1 Tax=Actinomadura verrucosospora TaxID=46165 RepID=UPI0031B60B0D